MSMSWHDLAHNFRTNLFQPLLLFFFLGFFIPLLKVPLEFPKALYKSLTIYLLLAIGWHGGVLMAQQDAAEFMRALGFLGVGFLTNTLIGLAATFFLGKFTSLRTIDAVTVGAYYGSDSAGTFVTCLGILGMLQIKSESYMSVMLAVMEIPGCLVGLYLVSRLRRQGMDARGCMPFETGYQQPDAVILEEFTLEMEDEEAEASGGTATAVIVRRKAGALQTNLSQHAHAVAQPAPKHGSQWKTLHEVFLNPGLYLLFGGILIGFISGTQGEKAVEEPDHVFHFLFKGILCLFLLEMGMTACQHLRDLRTAGWRFMMFGLCAPTVFATCGICVAHAYSMAIGHPFELGTYALFAVLCGASSYIAVPAVQRLAIPEASPTLPLAASLGLTFTWNVTLGIPLYIEIAKCVRQAVPI